MLQVDNNGEEAGSVLQRVLDLMPEYPAAKRCRQWKSTRVSPAKVIGVILSDMRDGIAVRLHTTTQYCQAVNHAHSRSGADQPSRPGA